ncbi:hypothetical protein CCMA1212_002499 [Trichoderma ghanense]|uniref:F-box domain-containing protein n=1 Tax=Trichoderma ghanense TaxID=65468 RepID=A0ABY2HBQ7_9HYPO
MNHLAYLEALRHSPPEAPSTPPSTQTKPPPSSSTSTSPTTPKVGFMSLPLELRFQIYTHLLTIPPSSSSTSSQPSHHALSATEPSPREPSRIHPAILLANRQINWEATPFLYSTNIFLAHPSLLTTFPRLRNWYPPLREAKTLVPRIRRFHVQVRLDLPLPFDREKAREAFSGLDELSIDVVQAMFLGVDCANLAVFEAVRGVKRVRIGGSTTGFEEYIAWLVEAMTRPVGTEVAPFEPECESPWAHLWSGHTNLVRSSGIQVEKEE